MYTPSISFTPAGMDACALWRMFIPHLNMPNSRFFFTTGNVPLDSIASADVGCVQRMMGEGNVEYMSMARQHGIRLIYDLDDNIWHMPAWNPAKHAFEEHRGGVRACVEWADVVTVSTPFLKKFAQREFDDLRNVVTGKPIPVVVVGNYADMRLFKEVTVPRNRDTVRIGWGGSNTHAGDLGYMWHIIPDIIEEFPNTEFEVIGHPPPPRLFNNPRVRMRNFCHVSEFQNRLATWDWDIVIAPLENNKFNKAKSAIKMVEAGSIRKPCLATSIDNYDMFCDFPGYKELKWQLCMSDFQWGDKLKELIRNESLRKELGDAMHSNVSQNYNIATQTWRWSEAAEMALRN